MGLQSAQTNDQNQLPIGKLASTVKRNLILLTFLKSEHEGMMQRYKQLLTYIKSAVTRNYSEKSINSILDYISTSKQMKLLQEFYETTLEALKDAKNDRLWFKTNTKLGKLYFDRGEFVKLSKILKQLHQSCMNDDGSDDLKKGTQLLEIYALEIQMYTVQKNNKKLKKLYEQSLHIKSAIPHPLIMGVIRECGGKMHLRETEYEKSHTDFFEAFKNYDESGSPRRTTCLKYLVLANMLMKSDINPFDSQEAKPYKNDPEILAMTNLVNAYQNNDINEFEKILKSNRRTIMDDLFIKEHIEDLLRNIRTQVLIKLIKPYTRIEIAFISEVSDYAALMRVELTRFSFRNWISTRMRSKIFLFPVSWTSKAKYFSLKLTIYPIHSAIQGRIDQVNQVLELNRESQSGSRFQAVDKWTGQLSSLHLTVMNRMA